jgi:hypothetical protein
MLFIILLFLSETNKLATTVIEKPLNNELTMSVWLLVCSNILMSLQA